MADGAVANASAVVRGATPRPDAKGIARRTPLGRMAERAAA